MKTPKLEYCLCGRYANIFGAFTETGQFRIYAGCDNIGCNGHGVIVPDEIAEPWVKKAATYWNDCIKSGRKNKEDANP